MYLVDRQPQTSLLQEFLNTKLTTEVLCVSQWEGLLDLIDHPARVLVVSLNRTRGPLVDFPEDWATSTATLLPTDLPPGGTHNPGSVVRQHCGAAVASDRYFRAREGRWNAHEDDRSGSTAHASFCSWG